VLLRVDRCEPLHGREFKNDTGVNHEISSEPLLEHGVRMFLIERWRQDYNDGGTHTSLPPRTPHNVKRRHQSQNHSPNSQPASSAGPR
jgi:hypothetical protein